MIKTLVINNLALIKSASVDFSTGINVIVGETGAGKSLVLQALALISGERANSDLIREDADNLTVEATFSINEYIEKVLKENKIEYQEKLVIYRFISKGKNIAKVNGNLITLKSLKKISKGIIDITEQDHSYIISEDYLISVLDKNSLNVSNYRDLYMDYKKLVSEESNLIQEKDSIDEKLQIIKYKISEFDSIYDIENLDILESDLLNISVKTKRNNVLDSLIRDLNSMDTTLISIIKSFNSPLLEERNLKDDLSRVLYCTEELRDINLKFQNFEKITVSQVERNLLVDKVSQVKKLVRKYKVSSKELTNVLTCLTLEKERLESLEVLIENNQIQLKSIISLMEEECSAIYKNRIYEADKLKTSILKSLSNLNMEHVKIRFDFENCNYNKNGNFKLSLKIATNNSKKYMPISNLASGGEVSRIMLSIKSAVTRSGSLIVFDEIDTGISGIIASKTADLIKNISLNNQIILVSHLIQVVSKADCFIKVNKCGFESTLKYIEGEEMVFEAAKLLETCGINGEEIELARKMIDRGRNV